MNVMAVIFWLSALTVVYTYVGYGLIIALLARLLPHPHGKGPIRPRVSLIIAAYNEEQVIGEKIVNSLCQTYPRELLEIVVVSDGSTDNTAKIVQQYRWEGVLSLHQTQRMGKPAAISRAAEQTSGEILVFSDANSMYAPDAIEKLVRNFADPAVGCVAGEKRIRSEDGPPVGKDAGLYWRYESFLKRMDSAVNSVVGAAGEILAVRRSLFQAPEPDSFIEDFVISMRIAASGHRVVYEPEAVSIEEAPASIRDEFERRARISAGGFQSIVRLRELFTCGRPMLLFQYLSHRVMRWAVVPFLLPVLFLSNLALVEDPLYLALFAGQLALLGLAASGWALENLRGRALNFVHVPFYFYMLNGAALTGFYRYISRRQKVTWKRTSRRPAGVDGRVSEVRYGARPRGDVLRESGDLG